MPIFSIKRECTVCPECGEDFSEKEILNFLAKKKHFKKKGRWKIHKFECKNCGIIWTAKQFKDSIYPMPKKKKKKEKQ